MHVELHRGKEREREEKRELKRDNNGRNRETIPTREMHTMFEMHLIGSERGRNRCKLTYQSKGYLKKQERESFTAVNH